jgi:hypothetical protein
MGSVLLDDREQIAEQATLGRGQLGTLDRAAIGAVLEAVDWRSRSDQRRGPPVTVAAALSRRAIAARRALA